MPPAVAAAGITAGAGLLGAGLSYKSSKSAQKSQEKATDQALAYTKEQDAARRKDYEGDYEVWRQQMAAWDASRRQLLGNLGFDTSGIPQVNIPSKMAPPMMGGGAVPRGMEGAPGGISPNQLAAAAQGGATVADVLERGRTPGDWNDWRSYGLGA